MHYLSVDVLTYWERLVTLPHSFILLPDIWNEKKFASVPVPLFAML